jgi:hypothetical protein
MTKQHPQKRTQTRQGNRFFSLMLIAGAFLIIDMLILLYFFWPGNSTKLPEQHSQSAVEQQAQSSAAQSTSPDQSRE